jgi:AcrR family transcriptional regulator
MGRWQPDARGRLATAAFELYAEQGYERTTGAEIADRAGMHERSFFRLFADKREVPFHGMEAIAADFTTLIGDAPDELSPIELAQLAVEAQCTLMQRNPGHAKLRHDIIASSADLRERDLSKQADLATAIADALHRRGIPETPAKLAAESCLLAGRISVDAWVDNPEGRDLVSILRDILNQLTATLNDRR